MTEPTWLSVLPPIVAIILAIWTRQVYISLFAGILLGWTILAGGNPLTGMVNALEGLVNVFKDGGNTKIILFCGLVGSLIILTQRSGGVEGFVNLVTGRGWVRSRRRAQSLSVIMGILIFVETSISCLIVGSISRPFFDRLKIPREKLAYICDSTCAPINLLIPINAWGAFIIGLLSKENIPNPLTAMISSLPYNIYAIFTLCIVFFIVFTGKDFGPMKVAENRARSEGKVIREGSQPAFSQEMMNLTASKSITPAASNLLIPVFIMIVMMPVSLFITGKGDLTQGSGSTAVFWSVLASITAASVLYSSRKILNLKEIMDLVMKGISGLVPLMLLMLLAFAIGDVAKELGTGIYVAKLASLFLNPIVIPPVLFLISCFIAFSTGTSWGTFSLLIPLAVPLAQSTGIHLPILISTILGGGLFGDHCSPISDTTIVASMASACDHIDHVRTQLPYAILAALAATLFYFLVSLF
jgi:tetracycline resistance efflux pump